VVPAAVGVFSHIVTDEVVDPSGMVSAIEVGGAGAFAAVGSSLVTTAGATILFAGVGAADHSRLAQWLTERGISPEGLFVHGEHSPVTEIRYDSDGERVEIPRYGLDHFLALSPFPRHARGHGLGGAYIFRDLDPEFWAELPLLRQGCRGPVLWELHAGVCAPGLLPAVLAIADQVDILSLNRTEARLLLDSADPFEILDVIPDRCAVALRMGGDGAVLKTGGTVYRLGTAPTPALDPTGGGNSWSGALVAHFAHKGDLVAAAKAATAAAAVVVAAPGAPLVGDALRARVAGLAGEVECAVD